MIEKLEYTNCATCGNLFKMSTDQRRRLYRNPNRKSYCSKKCKDKAFGLRSIGNTYGLGRKDSPETSAKKSIAQKGHPGYTLGYKHTPEAIARMSAALIGNKHTLGKKFSDEHKAKLGASKKGKKYWLGRKHTEEDLQKMRAAAHRGSGSHLWNGGTSSSNEIIRKSYKYREWRTTIFNRDDFTCVMCFRRGGKLEAHHIKRFSESIELRFDIKNGVTLCIDCHNKTKHHEEEYEKYFIERSVNKC